MIAERIRRMALGLALALPIIIFDQLSKWAVVNTLAIERRGTIAILPFLNFTWAKNTGTAMSLIVVNSDEGYWLLVAITAVASGAILWWLGSSTTPQRIALAGILGGAIGNFIDRIRLGYVIDFIHLHLGYYSFYIFNVADSAITLGVVALLLLSITSDDMK
jgi:signal peptidase II